MSTLKIASNEDVETIVKMGMEFLATTEFAQYSSEDHVRDLVVRLVNAPATEAIAFVADGGMILGLISRSPFGPYKVATEIGWWVDPDKRKSGLGKELLSAFEYWATVNQCKGITMISLDDKLGKWYESQNYKLREHVYMKEIN